MTKYYGTKKNIEGLAFTSWHFSVIDVCLDAGVDQTAHACAAILFVLSQLIYTVF